MIFQHDRISEGICHIVSQQNLLGLRIMVKDIFLNLSFFLSEEVEFVLHHGYRCLRVFCLEDFRTFIERYNHSADADEHPRFMHSRKGFEHYYLGTRLSLCS